MSGYGSRLSGRARGSGVLPWALVAAVAAVLGTGSLLLAGVLRLRSTLTVPLAGVAVPTVAAVAMVLFVLALVVGVTAAGIEWSGVRESWTALALWVRAPAVGLAGSLLAGAGLVVVGDASLFWTVLSVLAAWPLCTAGLVLRARRTREEGTLGAALVGSGFAQLRGPERRTVSVFAGGLLALAVGALTALTTQWLVGSPDERLAVGVGAVVWPLSGVLVHRRYAATGDAGGLVVRDIRTRAGQRELRLVNDADGPIDLGGAHLRDTEHERYRVALDRELGPGQQCVIAVPASFSLAPDETAVSLPLGYTLERGSVLPVLFDRRGRRYELRRSSASDSTGERNDDG